MPTCGRSSDRRVLCAPHPRRESAVSSVTPPVIRVDVVRSVTQADTLATFGVYDAVFGDQPGLGEWLEHVWDPHVARDGFRLARAYEDDLLVGFGYGYTGNRGQWWTDRAATVLPPEVAETWLGGHFELVSVGVLESARGHGLGSALLRALTAGLPHDRWLLMTTADADDPARRLYAREGWAVLGPGLQDDQVIMGHTTG